MDGVSRRCELAHPFVIPDVLRGLLYRLQPAESRWLTPEGSTKLVEFQAIDRRAAAARAAAAQAAAPPPRSVAPRARGPRRASVAPAPAAAPAAAGAVYSASQSAALIREANAIILAEDTAGPPTSSTFTYGEEALVVRARGRRASPAGAAPVPVLQALRGPEEGVAAQGAPPGEASGGGDVLSDGGYFEGHDGEPARDAGGE